MSGGRQAGDVDDVLDADGNAVQRASDAAGFQFGLRGPRGIHRGIRVEPNERMQFGLQLFDPLQQRRDEFGRRQSAARIALGDFGGGEPVGRRSQGRLRLHRRPRFGRRIGRDTSPPPHAPEPGRRRLRCHRGIRRGPCPGQRPWRERRRWDPWGGSPEKLCGCERGREFREGEGVWLTRVHGIGTALIIRHALLARGGILPPGTIPAIYRPWPIASLFDVIIIGAGAAGLMCAIAAGQRGRRVLLLDHAAEPGAKILISGGGRCNFTNTCTAPERFLSENPHFCPLGAGPLHAGRLHRDGAASWHRLPRENQRPVVLRRLRPRHRRHAAGGSRRRGGRSPARARGHRPEQSRICSGSKPTTACSPPTAWFWRPADCRFPSSAPPASRTTRRAASACG